MLPLSAAIPFALSVVTVSKPLPRTYDKRVWPTPPLRPREVKLLLKQSIRVRSRTFERTHTLPLSSLWGSVDIERLPDEWLPYNDKKQRGRWKQETVFTSVFRLRCPPAFRFSRLGYEVEVQVRILLLFRTCSSLTPCLQYCLYVMVRLGRLRSLSTVIPVTVSSGVCN